MRFVRRSSYFSPAHAGLFLRSPGQCERPRHPRRGLSVVPPLAVNALSPRRFLNSSRSHLVPRPPGGVPSGHRSLHHAEAPAVLNHSRTLAQGDGRAGPAFAGGAVGSECNLIVLDAGDVFHDAFAVRGPGIDAESEVRSDFHAITLTSSRHRATRVRVAC